MINSRQKMAWLATVAVGAFALRTWIRQQRRLDLQNKTVLITGGSRGLGLVLAREFASRGAHLLLCARNETELARAAEELRLRNALVQTCVCDVTDADAVHDMLHNWTGQGIDIDIVVNNAGVIQAAPAEVMGREDYQQAWNTHVWGPLIVNEAILPHFVERGGGRIVNISSIGGLVSVPHLLPYCTSKFGLVGYSLGLRNVLLNKNIFVSTICPGLMRTGSPQNALFKGRRELEYAWFKLSSSIPGLTVSAESAARRIVRACEYGEAFTVIGLPMKVAATLHALAPGIAADGLGYFSKLLPPPTGRNGEPPASPGGRHETPITRSWLTKLTDDAAHRNNEGEPSPASSGS